MANRRGVLAFVLLLTLLGSLVLYASLTMRRPASSATPSTAVLVFDVPSTIDEGELPIRPYSLDVFRARQRPVVYDVARAIRHAADDDRVKALVLHVGELDWGWARLSEVRGAVLRFRSTGKPVYASLTGGGEAEYLLGSAARIVSAPPTVSLALDGLTLSAMFLRGTLDKVGISPNFSSVGEYKSAVESYTRTDLSAPAREALDAVLDDEYALLADSLGRARGIAPDSVRRLLDRGPFTATEALAAGLLDTLLYSADVETLAVHRAGRHAGTVDLERYLDRIGDGGGGTRVALLTAEGTIAGGRSRSTPGGGRVVGSETMIETLRDIARQRSIKALVLRVDSPGGDAQASDDIWREVERLARLKPVVVSMSDYAASGGYYIAMGGRRIVAEPGTLTGSIGIFGGKFNLLGLYQKLGLSVETLSRGAHADMLSPFRDFTPEERDLYHRHLEEFYRGFVAKVAKNRHRAEAEVDSLARGRVWTGRAAFENGLVDTLGGIQVALDLARDAAGLPIDAPLRVERYPSVERPFLTQLFESLAGDDDHADESAVAALFPRALRTWAAAAVIPAARPLALIPFLIEVR